MAGESDDPIIQKALDKIAWHNAEAARLMAWVNEADALADREPRFTGVDVEVGGGPLATAPGASKKWQPGDFYKKSFTGACRMVLEARHQAANGPSPATVDEIYDALVQGAFAFDTTGTEAQKNSIRISLGKNSLVFVKLPGTELFGLAEWYGGRVRKSGAKKGGGNKIESSTDEEDVSEDPASLEAEDTPGNGATRGS